MSQQPSGWYDDPSNPEMLRYWDGVTWTNHTAPKKSPTASQSTIGLPQQTAPQTPAPTSPMTQGGPWQGQNTPQYPAQYQHYPQYPQAPGAAWLTAGPTTTDGVPLASWGKRLAAWLIDGVILLVLTMILVQLFVPDYAGTVQRFVDAASAQDQKAMENLVGDVASQAVRVGLVSWLTISIYCIAFWTTLAQTPGKMAVGISVRRADAPGPLDLGTAVRRRLISLIQIVPFISGVYFIVFFLDYLWPLWDAKRQALHDKVARTQIVQGKQPRRQG